MFKKQATYKSATAIRNSERKSLLSEVRTIYATALAAKSEEEVKDILDLILPSSGIEASSFTGTKGQRGTLYSHSNVAIFIKFDNHLVPSLHTLWKYPALTTTVLTGSQVLSNLQAGSDLMVKGMFEYSSRVKTGESVGILITGKSHVVAVGLAAVDFSQVDREVGGKGIFLVSCLGDTLTPESSFPNDEDRQVVEVTRDLKASTITDESQTERNEDNGDIREDVVSLSTAEIDDAFVQALLYGLYNITTTKQELNFPMPSSTLVDVHVLPYLPSKHPDLTFKKTSWKKASKFLSKQKLIKSKETKGQLNILGIDWSSTDLSSFKPYQLPTSEIKTTQVESSQDDDEKHTIEVEELYKVPSTMTCLMTQNFDEKLLYTKEELRIMLNRYFETNNLITGNPKMITVDPQIYHTIGQKSSSSQKELSKDVLLKSFVRQCLIHHRLNGGKVKKGPVATLEVVMESRQGKKSVTRVVHLERFFSGQQVEQIVDELKKKCAVSVSTGEVKGTKPGSSVEVMVQGKKSTEVCETLESWGVKKAWIKVEDKTK